MAVAAFYVLYLIFLIAYIMLRRAAFRTSIGWGLTVLFVSLGSLIFAIKHWSEVGKVYLLSTGIAIVQCVLVFTVPSVMAIYAARSPAFVTLFQLVNPKALAIAQHGEGAVPADSSVSPGASPTPHEVRDLAESETTVPIALPADPNAAQRAAYAKHAKELTAAYQQLNAERLKLKPKSPAVAAFNAKAARYQHDLQTLAEEKTRLDALDHARNANAEAAAALASLRTSADAGDYEAFAATLKKSLSEYRQTPAFPQIVAFARPALQQATPDKVLAGLQGKTAAAARAEFDRTTRQVQAIVNQAPPMVPKPAADADVYHYSYHPGANQPDYNAENLLGTREIWKGEYAYIEAAPNVYYRSADCEFNPQTKYFYLSRTMAKKRLSDAEYAELTRLYHLLGQQEKAIVNVPPPTADAERVSGDLAALKAQLDGYAMR